jgi:chromosome segregation protein
MKIKKIDVVGFKSFMEKATLSFPEKITAIVGPNGCGKSNIVDSIRWVIGEQSSKHLRGKGMEDMIFAGSEKFSSLGMAEVKITFTNDKVNAPIDYSEYNEITVSRRLFKSGESEYKINNTRCRLMDIRELFMDTGISAKAYAIVEQGKVDSIVNSKPEDKRVIIEEAAGITKYKNRKDAALKKIASTEQNLTRTKDIISEIKKQLNAVERQAKRAESFKKLRKDFKDIELNLIHLDNEKLKKSFKSLEHELKVQDESAIKVSKTLKVKENALETLRIKNLDVEKESNATQELYLNQMNEVRKKETEIEFKERRREELHEQKVNSLSEIEDLKSSIKDQSGDVETEKQKVKDLEAEFLIEEKRVFSIQKEYEELNSAFREKTSLIDKEKGALVNILTNIARTRNDMANFEGHIETFNKSHEKLRKEEDFLSERILKASKETKDLDSKNSRIEKEKDELTKKRIQNELELSGLNEEYDIKTGEKASLENELMDVTAKLNSLSELKESYEGFTTGVKEIMSGKKELGFGGDILGVVSDFIDVSKEYETSISSFLGERLEYIIVKSKSSIIKAVKHLKKNNLGKAGFILIGGAGKKGTNSGGKLPDLLKNVKIKKELKPYISDIFGDVRYADTFESAVEQFTKGGGAVYVTKDGDIVGNVIYGGSKSVKGKKILSREREIKELEKKRSELNKKFLAREKVIERLKKDITRAEEVQEDIRDSLHDVQIRSLELNNTINRSNEEVDRLKGRNEIITFELNDLKSQTDELNNRLLLSKVRLEEFSAEKEKKEAAISEYSSECDELNNTLKSKSEELTLVRVNVARLKAEKENILRSIQLITDTLDSNNKRVEKLKNGIDIIEKEEADIKVQVKEIELELKATVKLGEKTKMDVDRLKETFLKNMEIMRNNELELSSIKNELTDVMNKKNELSLKKEELTLNLRSIEDKLRDKYQKTIGEIESIEIPESFNKSSAVKRLEVLRKKIYDMGEVNLLAIEEYEELNTRYTFIMEQQQDLLTSISTLNKAIKRINRTSRKRFKETYDLVNEKFKVIFPKLFNGGHAELRLLDEEDILESGVQIVAQPPGKKLQNITLLSGGEKALTAVSLIFAIFMIKPSPFCLLDEVDAPLDEANIGRFTDLVKDMSEASQFIIITHSKKTMEIADTLYGVTMESPGISKIVSVQMH